MPAAYEVKQTVYEFQMSPDVTSYLKSTRVCYKPIKQVKWLWVNVRLCSRTHDIHLVIRVT